MIKTTKKRKLVQIYKTINIRKIKSFKEKHYDLNYIINIFYEFCDLYYITNAFQLHILF